MARPRRPWIKVLIDILSHEKMAALPNDSARLGWFAVLLEAKTQRRMGIFGSRAHLRAVLGQHGKYVPDYIAQQLAHEAPIKCAGCKKQYPDATTGNVVIHDYRKEQRDPTHVDRQQLYDASHGGVSDAIPDAIDDGGNGEGNPFEPEVSDAKPDGVSDGIRTQNLTADSRARGTTVTLTTTEEESPASVDRDRATAKRSTAHANGRSAKLDVRLTKRELESWDSFAAPEWSAFKTEWLGRGLHYAPFGAPDDDDTSQRGLLWQIADARPHDLARWVREAPGKTSREVIDHVLSRWHEVRADAGVDDEAWQEEKADDRRRAGRELTKVGDLFK